MGNPSHPSSTRINSGPSAYQGTVSSPASTIHNVELVVRYTPPDELDFDEVVLQSGDVLVIGRHPGPEGIELYEADRTISRVAVELSLVDDGVRVRNRNRYLSIQLGNLDYAGMDLAPGEAHTLSRSGWVTIPDQHQIKFELSGSAPGDPTTTLSGSTTLTDPVRKGNSVFL